MSLLLWGLTLTSLAASSQDNIDFIMDHNKNHADTLGYTVGVNQVNSPSLACVNFEVRKIVRDPRVSPPLPHHEL